MAHPRLVISLCALCLCGCVGISPAFGSITASGTVQVRAFHAKAKAKRSSRHPARCAGRASSRSRRGHRRPAGRASSFHATHRHKKPSGTSCQKHGSTTHHKAAAPKKTSPKPLSTSGSGTGSGSGYGQQAPAPGQGASDESCPDTTLAPDQNNLDLIRAAVLCLVNRERTTNGEDPLTANPRLEQAAQAHSESMASEDYFAHISPQGETPVMRMRAAGYIYSSQIGYEVGENIGWGTLSESTPAAVVAAWMASPGHRANILDAHFRDTAVGVSPHPFSSLAHGQRGAIYTQDFGVIIVG